MQIGLNFYDPPILTHCHLVQDVLSVKNIKLSTPTPNVIGTKHLFINLLPLFFKVNCVFFTKYKNQLVQMYVKLIMTCNLVHNVIIVIIFGGSPTVKFKGQVQSTCALLGQVKG